MNMTPGANASVPTQLMTICVQSDMAIYASAFRLYESGKVKNDADMVFYGQPTNDDETISYHSEGNNSVFTFDLSRLHKIVQKMAFTATCNGNQTISSLQRLSIQVDADNEVLLNGTVETHGRQEAALILGELYFRNSTWKFRFIAEGFNGGLKPLAECFCVDIEDTPTPVPTPQPINLSKVSLTKEKPSISLVKKDDLGKIRINLDWHRNNNHMMAHRVS